MEDDSLPYESRRAPLFAKNIVATSQPLAAQAGLNILQLQTKRHLLVLHIQIQEVPYLLMTQDL